MNRIWLVLGFSVYLLSFINGCGTGSEQQPTQKPLALMQGADQSLYIVSCVKSTGIQNTSAWKTSCKFEQNTLADIKSAGSAAKEKYSSPMYSWYFDYDYFYYYNINNYSQSSACGLMGFMSSCYNYFGYQNSFTNETNSCDNCQDLWGGCSSLCYVPVTTNPTPPPPAPKPTPQPVLPTPAPPVQPAPVTTAPAPSGPTLVAAICVGGPNHPSYAFSTSNGSAANKCGQRVQSFSHSCLIDMNLRSCMAWSNEIDVVSAYNCVCDPNLPSVGNWN
jgi:hypothetical protein